MINIKNHEYNKSNIDNISNMQNSLNVLNKVNINNKNEDINSFRNNSNKKRNYLNIKKKLALKLTDMDSKSNNLKHQIVFNKNTNFKRNKSWNFKHIEILKLTSKLNNINKTQINTNTINTKLNNNKVYSNIDNYEKNYFKKNLNVLFNKSKTDIKLNKKNINNELYPLPIIKKSTKSKNKHIYLENNSFVNKIPINSNNLLKKLNSKIIKESKLIKSKNKYNFVQSKHKYMLM